MLGILMWRFFLFAHRMPFIDMVIEDMQTIGDSALDTSAPFDEAAVLSEVLS